MILALDVGNTNIVIGIIDDGEIVFDGRLTTNTNSTDMEIAVMLNNILSINSIDTSKIDGAIISSVVPPIDRELKKAVKIAVGKEPIIVSGNEGIKIEIDHPSQLGKDIIVSAVAALNEFKPPLVLIDMGTATTMFVVDENGSIIGGAIMPGVMVSQRALSGTASLLPSIGFEAPENVIGKNTIDSMKSGIVLGNASMLDGMIDRIEEQLGKKVTSIATGGLSYSIIQSCRHHIEFDKNLLLKGLWQIFKNHSTQ